jgi:hypothetical protein
LTVREPAKPFNNPKTILDPRSPIPGTCVASRAWATVNKMDHGGKKSGSGRGRTTNKAPARKGGRKGGRSTARTRIAARKTSGASRTSRKASRKTGRSSKKK